MSELLLAFALFFPRLTLLVAYLNGGIPPNIIPFGWEFTMSVLAPRFLVMFYIVDRLGWNSGWLIAHFIFAILASVGSASVIKAVQKKVEA